MRSLPLLLAITVLTQAAGAAPIVETFEGFPEDTVVTNQIPGLLISADTGTPTVRIATNPVVPGEPKGLAHIPYFDFPDILAIDFLPSTSTVGAIVDFGNVGSGVRLTAYDGPGGTGNVVGTASTTTEVFINVTHGGIRSARFETLDPSVSYLIDNLTYELEPPISVEAMSWSRTKALYR